MRTKYETRQLKDAFDVIGDALVDLDNNHGACLCSEVGDGLVVPTSDVLNLAQHWDDIYFPGHLARADELRALTQQEPR